MTQTPTTKSPVTGSPTIEPVVECYSDDTSCGNWFGCEPGESCSTCCGKMSGKTCNDEVMYEHKCEVYTVQALTRQAEANSLNCTSFYPTLNNAAPFFQNGTCAFPHPRRPRANVQYGPARLSDGPAHMLLLQNTVRPLFPRRDQPQKCRWHPGRHSRCLD